MLLPEPPRVGEPESALIPGMSAPKAEISPLAAMSFGGVGGLADTSTAAPTPPGELLQSPIVWTYDLNPTSGNWRATFQGEVNITQGGAVTSFNGRTGAVTLTAADLTGAGGLTANNAALTGTPTAPTASPASTSTTQIATTAFVQQAIAATPTVNSFNGRLGNVTLSASDITSAGGALTASPALTGTPTAPTATLGDASSLIASTQFVANAIGGGAVTAFNGRKGAVTLQLTDVTTAGGAPLASPGFTGTPNAPTAAPGTATTQLATTAFVTNAITGATTGVSSFNTRTGAVTLQTADITGAGGAPNTSPNFAGTPQAPTATAGTATAQIATTQFVATAISNLPAGVSTFNGRSGTVTLQLADVTSVGGAPLASPTFTGTPTAPTPTAGDSSSDIATTSFVSNAITTAGALYVPKAGGTMTGALTVNSDVVINRQGGGQALTINGNPQSQLFLNKTATNSNNYIFGQTNGANRWILTLGDATAETGSDTGSQFNIYSVNDAGSATSLMQITRNTRVVTFPGQVNALGGIRYAVNNNSIGFLWSTYLGMTIDGNPSVPVVTGVYPPGGYQGVTQLFSNTANTVAELYAISGSATWSTVASDRRLKSNLKPAGDALDAIRRVKVYGLDFAAAETDFKEYWPFSLVADEVADALPHAAMSREEDDGLHWVGLHPTHLCAVLWKAVQQLADKVATLEAQMETLSP